MSKHHLKLYVWPSGSGFNLPSINAECLSALALLSFLSSSDISSIKWSAVPSWDASSSPNGDFPMLECSCGTIAAGFSMIKSHLRSCELLNHDDGNLDKWMNDTEMADCTAWTTHLATNGRQIIDLYLYVTWTNYVSTTRPSYTHFLPWIGNYLIPPSHRSAAVSRTQHLDLGSLLDTSEAEENEHVKTRSGGGVDPTVGFTERFRLALRKEGFSTAQKRVRLEALMARWLDPLNALLGEKKFFLSDSKVSSLDGLALGYLSLLLDADVPDLWAAQIVKDKYPRLLAWTRSTKAMIDSEDGWWRGLRCKGEQVGTPQVSALESAMYAGKTLAEAVLPIFP